MEANWNRYLDLRDAYPRAFSSGAPAGLRTDADAPQAAGAPLGVAEEHPRWLWVREWDGRTVSERPVYLDQALEQQIEGYFALCNRRPELFAPSDLTPLILDRLSMLSFLEETGKQVGLVFDNLPFYQVVSDLVADPKLHSYGRVLYPDRQGNGTVIIPRLDRGEEEPLFGILHLFRHPIRAMAGGEFPRGFQAPGITPEENAAKELWEELGVRASQLARLTKLGRTRPDTGLSSGEVQIYLADLTGDPPRASLGSEGIAGCEWITESELMARLGRGDILDGMTQTAVLLYQLHKQQ